MTLIRGHVSWGPVIKSKLSKKEQVVQSQFSGKSPLIKWSLFSDQMAISFHFKAEMNWAVNGTVCNR